MFYVLEKKTKDWNDIQILHFLMSMIDVLMFLTETHIFCHGALNPCNIVESNFGTWKLTNLENSVQDLEIFKY